MTRSNTLQAALGRSDRGRKGGAQPGHLALAAALAVLLGGASPASAVEVDAIPANPKKLLEKAFENQYNLDSTAKIELVIRNRSGQERRRNFEAVSKIIEDRMHSIGRLTYPAHLRGMTILQIEAEDRSHDAFIYLPSSQAVRRVSTAQRGDAFFGTDVTYEDLERRYAKDYDIIDLSTDRIGGEATYAVRARPKLRQSYHEVVFWLAQSDDVILQAHYFKRDASEPYRTIDAPRASMQEAGDHTLPTRLIVENRARGTTTEVTYRNLAIDPEIDDRLFSIRTLAQKRRIPTSN
jgi:hypothetical protein